MGYDATTSLTSLSWFLNSRGVNRPRSIYQYSNMAPRLSGQTSIFGVVFFVSKSPLGIERQKKLEKFSSLTRKPRSHARILIYRTWPILYTTVITPWLRLTQSLTIFVCSVFNLNNKNVNALIARELSGFTCTRSLTMNSKFSILHSAASCGIEFSRSLLLNSCR